MSGQALNEHNVLAAQLRDANHWLEAAEDTARVSQTVAPEVTERLRQLGTDLREVLSLVEVASAAARSAYTDSSDPGTNGSR